MGEEFSFKNIRIFTDAYSNYLKKKFKHRNSPRVIVNYDTRFLSEEFAREAAKMFSLNGIQALMTDRDAPLAAASLALLNNNCWGGITFTASFNKPVYNGIKVFNDKGIPALPQETDQIEAEINQIAPTFHFKPQYADYSLIEIIDVQPPYIEYLEKLIDFDLIKKSGIKIIVDNLFGTSREYLDAILIDHDIEAISIHNFPYSDFGGVVSSCEKHTLKDLSRMVVQEKADLGLATDIDGDRFGIIDFRGRFLNSNIIMPPLIEYLIMVRKMEGGIVKSISSTHNIRKVAEFYSRPVYTTPVGFKFLAEKLHSHHAFIGVESSNGAALNQIVKIKDGILFSLLITEMRAYYQRSMKEILEDFYQRFPHLFSHEIALKQNEKNQERFNHLLSSEHPKIDCSPFHVKKIDYTDGIKFRFDDSWLLLRQSGTNPVYRIYAESPSLKQTRELIKLGHSFID